MGGIHKPAAIVFIFVFAIFAALCAAALFTSIVMIYYFITGLF